MADSQDGAGPDPKRVSGMQCPRAILSYPQLLEPKPDSKGKQKYSCALLFPKGSDLRPLKLAVIAAAEAKYGKERAAEMFRTKKLRSPFRTDWEAKNYPEVEAFFNTRTTYKPALFDNKAQAVSPEQAQELFYPGAFVKASLTAYWYSVDGNTGITFGLNAVQFVGHGERIDNRVNPEDDFAEDLSGEPAALPSELDALMG